MAESSENFVAWVVDGEVCSVEAERCQDSSLQGLHTADQPVGGQ